jgi:dTMP kinase
MTMEKTSRKVIIVFEGMDASGKCTQSKLLAEKLPATRFSFPNYESPTGKAIRGWLEGRWQTGYDPDKNPNPQIGLDPILFQSLQATNRLELFPKIRQTPGNIVFDRYWQSGYVYGKLEGLDTEWLDIIQRQPMPSAELNIFLDVPVEESFKRRPERRDRYEADQTFLNKVRSEYLKLWVNGAVGGGIWATVDGMGTVEEVHNRIMTLICDLFS